MILLHNGSDADYGDADRAAGHVIKAESGLRILLYK
jgi:hypothetical protein